MTESDRELTEIFAAYDLTKCTWSAAQLAGCHPKTVQRYVAMREAEGISSTPASRPKSIDPFLAKIEEKVERSGGKVRADVVRKDLRAMGFRDSGRTTQARRRGDQGVLASGSATCLPALDSRARETVRSPTRLADR